MIDIVLGGILLVSALLGLFRGFIGIVVGTLSWLLAGWATFRFGGDAALWLSTGQPPSTSQYVAGYALVFIGVLVAVAVLGMLIRAGVNAVSLGGMDRLLGFALGLVRGAFLACVAVVLMSFTPLAAEPAWRQSVLLPLLQPGVAWMQAQLPDWRAGATKSDTLADRDLGKPPITGDNAGLGEAISGSVKDTVARALQRRFGAAAGDGQESGHTLPANIDPAQERGGDYDPAQAGSQGQVRPPSQ